MNALSTPQIRLEPLQRTDWAKVRNQQNGDFVGLRIHDEDWFLQTSEAFRAFKVMNQPAEPTTTPAKFGGWCAFSQLEWKNRSVCIAWDLQEQGLATQVADVMLRFAFHELNLERIEGRVIENSPAARVLEQHGFELEVLEREAVFAHGAWLNVAIYGLLTGTSGSVDLKSTLG